jgi:hypothetical protein
MKDISDKVIRLGPSGSYTVEQALNDCLHRDLEQVLIIGKTQKNELFIRSSKMPYGL